MSQIIEEIIFQIKDGTPVYSSANFVDSIPILMVWMAKEFHMVKMVCEWGIECALKRHKKNHA